MKFEAERDVFAEAVTWTARSLPGRPAAPVLAGLLFEASDRGPVSVSGFDYEASGRAGVPAEVSEPGRLLVHGRLLADIAKSLPNRPVRIAAAGPTVMLSCGSSQFALPTLPVGEYPELPAMPAAVGSVTGSDLAAAVAQVAVAAARDDTIPMLTGIRVEFEGDTLTLVSTDRFRLAYRELPWQPAVDGPATSALLPAKVMAAAARALAGRDQVTLALAEDPIGTGLIGFASEDHPKGARHLTSRLLSGEFVKYRSLFASEYPTTATVETAPFLAAAKRVALVAERTSPILLAFAQGTVTLKAGNGDEAQASESLEAVLTGEDVTASFNPAYLLDGLGVIDTPYAQLSFTAPGKPTVLMARESLDVPARDDFRYLMLPLKAPANSGAGPA